MTWPPLMLRELNVVRLPKLLVLTGKILAGKTRSSPAAGTVFALQLQGISQFGLFVKALQLESPGVPPVQVRVAAKQSEPAKVSASPIHRAIRFPETLPRGPTKLHNRIAMSLRLGGAKVQSHDYPHGP